MAPKHRKEGHYCCLFGRIVGIFSLFLVFYDGSALAVSHGDEGLNPNAAAAAGPGNGPQETDEALRQQGEIAHYGADADMSKELDELQTTDGDLEGAERSQLTYSVTSGTSFMNVLGGEGDATVDGIPAELLVEKIRDIEEENNGGNKRVWPVVVFENQKIVCSCVAVHDFQNDKLVYERFWVHPDTINKRKALEVLLKEMLNPPAPCKVEYITVNSSPKNWLLIDVLAKAGLSLKNYKRDANGDGAGLYQWAIDLPYLGSYQEHRNQQMEVMGEKAYVMQRAVPVPKETTEYMSTSEAEVFDTVFVQSLADLSPREYFRAWNVVLENAKKDPERAGIVGVYSGTNFSFAAVGTTSGTVFGVVRAHVNDENVGMIDFLGANGLHEEYIKATLLLEALKNMQNVDVEKVILKGVPIDDIGTVGLAAELGFVVKASSENSFMMVRDGSVDLPLPDYITLPRLYRAQYTVLKNLESRRRALFEREYLDIVEAAMALLRESPGLIAKKTEDLFVYVGVALLAIGVIMIARAVRNVRKREAQIKRLRYAQLPDDIILEGDGASAEAGEAVAAEHDNLAEVGAAANRPM
ncbi:hypothetical protein, conserved [Eimeria brunetti]|uniref:Uncharacterized protein n=1 Tax=Eimeria brunetti TaxID=51314 RepID=U6LEY5_9EIME|nr:hypothetical protein, conserved [Eimeria brunetti]